MKIVLCCKRQSKPFLPKETQKTQRRLHDSLCGALAPNQVDFLLFNFYFLILILTVFSVEWHLI